MEACTRYPGSFGEIVQGSIGGKDLLVSCPVNLFTEARIFESKNPDKKLMNPKASMFMKNMLCEWGYVDYFHSLDVEIFSEIPVGKGLASSTADMCAAYHSLVKLFQREFNQDELVRNCLNIEPTDSIIFNELTLFDYKKGHFKEKIGKYFKFHILAFEGEGVVDTVEFNKSNLSPLSSLDDVFEDLKNAMQLGHLKTIFEISEESIMRNRKRIPYPWFERVHGFKEITGGLGIMGAHSGNVLGIVFEDEERAKHALELVIKQEKQLKIQLLQSLETVY